MPFLISCPASLLYQRIQFYKIFPKLDSTGLLPSEKYFLAATEKAGAPRLLSLHYFELTIAGQVDTSCGESNGSATVTASGGVLSYRYEWRAAGNALISGINQAAGLRSGDYRAYAYDGNNCPADILVTVNDSDGPEFNSSR